MCFDTEINKKKKKTKITFPASNSLIGASPVTLSIRLSAQQSTPAPFIYILLSAGSVKQKKRIQNKKG